VIVFIVVTNIDFVVKVISVDIFRDVNCFSAIMRLSNELVYSGALQCANDDVARATLCTTVSQQQVCLILGLNFRNFV